jgi:hypothetical protein
MIFLIRVLWVLGVICAGYYMYGPHGVVTSQWVRQRAYTGGQVTRADQEKADCIERYERGQRKTKAGC